jgi:hypothetical protein
MPRTPDSGSPLESEYSSQFKQFVPFSISPWQRPADPTRSRPRKIVLHRATGYPQRSSDLAGADAVVVQPQHLPQLSHGQLSLGRHQTLLAVVEGAEDLSR